MPWTVPVAMLLVVAALRGNTGGTLADAAFFEALRRAIVPPVERSMTMADVPAGALRPAEVEPPELPDLQTPPAGFPPAVAPPPPAPPEPAQLEAEWHDKMNTAREALERDQVLADGMQSRVNALTTDSIARDDPAQRADLLKQRARAIVELDHLTLQVEKDKLAIAAIEEEARKKGIPPGWIRSISELTN